MKVITILKYLVNFIFIAFLLTSALVLSNPFWDSSFAEVSTVEVVWKLVFSLIHLSVIFMILFYLRKFVQGSDMGTPFDQATRKYLRLSGIFCLVYSMIKVFDIAGLITYFRVIGDYDLRLVSESFLDFGSFFYLLFFGVFFIYLSKVLETSDLIREENKLTI